MLVIFLTRMRVAREDREEVTKMVEFLMTMAVIALIFVAATFLVTLVAGGLLKIRNALKRSGNETLEES